MNTLPGSLKTALVLSAVLFSTAGLILTIFSGASPTQTSFDDIIKDNTRSMMAEGRKTFRFDTFGDEAFWGGHASTSPSH